MQLRWWTFELPFQYPFTISKGTKTHQPTLIVELTHMGIRGYGEAPAIHYYNTSLASMTAVLEQKKLFIEKFAFTSPDRYWHYLHHLLPNDPFVVCALDMAAWDIFGKMKRMPLYQLWHTDLQEIPGTDYTIGIDSPERMVEKVQAKPWPIYKVKLGTPDDIAIIEAIRKVTAAPIRVDANAGWTTEQALQLFPALHALGVEMIEQPLAKDNWEGMRILYEKSPIPLFADEACVFEKDVAKCKDHFHGINIKLTKCSGITPALRMIEEARSLGLKVMMGCMNESTIGTSAIAQFAPQLDIIDMDGPLLLTEDLATGVSIGADGRPIFSGLAGLGLSKLSFL